MRLQFLGAARTVTGSCFLLEAAGKKILIDCGLFQGSKTIRALNYQNFHFTPSEIDCVLLTHAHVDHCGLIPKLCKKGFKGPIYATKVSCELAQIMLPDSAHIQEFDVEIMNRKGKRAGRAPVEPIYTVNDALTSLKYFSAVNYGECLQISADIKVIYKDAGHIIGSSFIEIYVTENNKTTKILFSGDLGQPNQPIIKNPTIIKGTDYLVMESTYGDRVHQVYDKEQALAEIINDTIARGGNVIIPSFAVGRTQTMLYYLYKLWKDHKIKDIPVIVDSPLAAAATRIFAHNTQDFDEEMVELLKENGKIPQMPQLRICESAEESKAINSQEGSAIIISASGMADAGRVLHHLKHNLWRDESSVLFVGYQAEGSMGRRLLEGIRRVKIMGEEVTVKAKIYNMEGFSAHADRNQILDWLANFTEPKPVNIFIVHGESLAAGALKEAIQERFDETSYIPHYGDTAIINGRDYEIEPTKIIEEVAVKDLEEFLTLIDADYRQLRQKLLRTVFKEPEKLQDITKNINKGWNYFKKLFNDIN
jgi:metallo-beta-lactamase family protein